jgi:hypothetical protein
MFNKHERGGMASAFIANNDERRELAEQVAEDYRAVAGHQVSISTLVGVYESDHPDRFPIIIEANPMNDVEQLEAELVAARSDSTFFRTEFHRRRAHSAWLRLEQAKARAN